MRYTPDNHIYPRKIIQYTTILLVIFFLYQPIPVKAGPMDRFEVAEKLQATYDNAETLVADFSQTTTMKFSSRVRRGSGSLVFSKPGRMRWDYLTPDHQVIISDGETITMYFEKNHQVIISSAKDYLQSDVTYSFFAGSGNILKDFDVSEPDIFNQTEKSFLIKLKPKSVHPHVASLHVWVDQKDFLITRMQILDHFDTVTDLYFDNIEINADHHGNRKINEDLFTFSPPPGTEIIEQF